MTCYRSILTFSDSLWNRGEASSWPRSLDGDQINPVRGGSYTHADEYLIVRVR